MLILVTYDVNTISEGGARRLRRVAKACQDFGQRVQISVFECLVDPAQWARLRQRLIQEIDVSQARDGRWLRGCTSAGFRRGDSARWSGWPWCAERR